MADSFIVVVIVIVIAIVVIVKTELLHALSVVSIVVCDYSLTEWVKESKTN